MKKIGQYKWVFILTFCVSCVFDPPRSHVRIENSSVDTIEILVNFNRLYVSNMYKSDSCLACIINSIHCYDSSISLVRFDTTNLIGTYKIAPDHSFKLFLSLYQDPGFEFDSIKVFHSLDTLKINGKLGDLEKLKKHKWQVYVLNIK